MTQQQPKGAVVLDTDSTPEVLASAIEDVADAARRLLGSRLSERAIVLLLHDHSGVPQKQIRAVLNSAANLRFYVKVQKK
jgi:hypothetical protein